MSEAEGVKSEQAAVKTVITKVEGGNQSFTMGKWNTILTAVAALASTFIGVWVAFIDAHIKNIDKRDKIEDASYKFAGEFLAQSGSQGFTNAKRAQLTIAALHIIAEADTDESGESKQADRAELPIHMALLMNDPASIAVLDPECQYMKLWVDFAKVDQDDATRLTAIKALCALCRKALYDGQLSRMDRCLDNIKDLTNVFDHSTLVDPTTPYSMANIAWSRLTSDLKNADSSISAASFKDSDDKRSLDQIRIAVRKQLDITDQVGKVLDTAFQTRNDEGAPQQTQQSPGAALLSSDQAVANKQQPAATQDAIEAASSAFRTEITQGTADDKKKDAIQDKIGGLIDQLHDPSEDLRRKAQIQLTLLGQEAATRLYAALNEHLTGTTNTDEEIKYGVVVSLSRMQQPITAPQASVHQIVQLLRSPNGATRIAASDFLMNMEDPDTIYTAFDELNKVIESRGMPETGGEEADSEQLNQTAVFNAVTVLGTWIRALTPDTMWTDGVTSMPQKCLDAVITARAELKTTDNAWAHTIAVINELINRAKKAGVNLKGLTNA